MSKPVCKRTTAKYMILRVNLNHLTVKRLTDIRFDFNQTQSMQILRHCRNVFIRVWRKLSWSENRHVDTCKLPLHTSDWGVTQYPQPLNCLRSNSISVSVKCTFNAKTHNMFNFAFALFHQHVFICLSVSVSMHTFENKAAKSTPHNNTKEKNVPRLITFLDNYEKCLYNWNVWWMLKVLNGTKQSKKNL